MVYINVIIMILVITMMMIMMRLIIMMMMRGLTFAGCSGWQVLGSLRVVDDV